MVFWIFAILSVLGTALLVIRAIVNNLYDEEKKYPKFVEFFYWEEDFWFPICIFTMIILFIFVLMLIAIINAYVLADAERAAKEQQYQALVYKAQTESIRDEFGIINKEYIDEIQTWNQELAKYQSYSHNFWIGIFYPKQIYDGLEFIDWESVRMKE
ncbi:MAG: hypothetical protein HDQ95_14040 [Roseburia sp.]|nr:hypothetical protein [Roseburia sp.]